MKKKTIVSVLLFLIIFSSIGVVYYFHNFRESQNNTAPLKTTASKTKEINLIIDFGNNKKLTFSTTTRKKVTAFDILKEGAKNLKVPLETKKYDIGILVESINGVKNGEKGNYWLYYINGKMPNVSCDKEILSPGDRIEFRFEKSPF